MRMVGSCMVTTSGVITYRVVDCSSSRGFPDLRTKGAQQCCAPTGKRRRRDAGAAAPAENKEKAGETSGGGGLGLMHSGGTQIREEGCQDANRWKIRADVVDEINAGVIGELAERRRADTTQAERQAEKQAGDHADSSGHELLSIDQDRGERGCED